jgi:hypothetical protein
VGWIILVSCPVLGIEIRILSIIAIVSGHLMGGAILLWVILAISRIIPVPLILILRILLVVAVMVWMTCPVLTINWIGTVRIKGGNW